METSLYGQLFEVAAALLLGAGMGFVYDCMKIIRGRLPMRWLTALLDILFWVVCAAMAFWFAMTFGGGELRLFSLLAMALGIVVYFLLLSVYIRAAGFSLIDGAAELFRLLFRPFAAVGKIIHKILTKLFPFVRKWHILREERARRKLEQGELDTYETSMAEETGNPHIRGMVGGHSRVAARANQQKKGRKRSARGSVGGADASERNGAGGYRI